MRIIDGGSNQLYYLFTDHLGSTSEVRRADGTLHSRQYYRAFGEERYTSGALPTDRTYTGQREIEFGLVHYGARIYDPALGRFAQADTIIPQPGNPMAWDRFAYTLNNPVKYVDPTGHFTGYACKHMADGYCVDKSPSAHIFQDGINNMIISVYIESSAGKHSEQSTAMMSWVVINRRDNYNSKNKVVRKPYHASFYEYVSRYEQNGVSYKELLQLLEDRDDYQYVKSLFMDVYSDYKARKEDPTHGSIFFIHAKIDNIRKPEFGAFNNIDEAKGFLQIRSEEMQKGFTERMARAQYQIFPFVYSFSDVYYVDGIAMFLYTGNHVCSYAGSCGPEWLGFMPPQQ